jgi:hypothetical protein
MYGMVPYMISKPLVFISSTSDRKADRSALADALGPTFEPYLFEHDRARGASPRSRCAEVIEASDSFIGILGTEYGSVYEEESEQSDGRSITEWEFDTASQRDDLEMMMFVSADTGDKPVEPNQRSFLDRVQAFKGGLWCKFFSSPAELVDLVKSSLVQWLAEYLVQVKTRGDEKTEKRRKIPFIAASGVSLLALSSVIGHFLFGLFYKSAVLTICGVALGAIIALMLLVLNND